ncbi:MAG TPA: cytochrome c biogenesis protein CcsA [Bryobacteraceae bacterium]|nr:cytochrome c biogenesis protein CcsA [Bryobacteraceae bacterium]
MRQKVIYVLCGCGALVIARNLYVVFLQLPDERLQDSIWRIFTFHLPAAIVSMTGFAIALGFSGLYLWKRDLRFDGVAAATTEVSFALALVTLVTGSIWARIIWGVWWAWDPRLTSYFICLLIYSGYLMFRRVIEEPETRARLSAVLSAFGFVDIIVVWKSIEWWKTLHPGPVLSIRTGGGRIDPAFESAAWWNVLAIALLAVAFVLIRMNQEQTRRELDAMRRLAHVM